ncbi:MAG: IPT/TIG domain-containing protein [Terracidiphilus sp.]
MVSAWSDSFGTYTLTGDVYRANEENSSGDWYAFLGNWNSEPGGLCPQTATSPWGASFSCGPYVVERNIEMPGAPPTTAPFTEQTGPLTLVGSSPSTTIDNVTGSTSFGLGVNVSANPSANVTTSMTAGWSSPDISTYNYEDLWGPNTDEWGEVFTTPTYGTFWTGGNPPGNDAMAGFSSSIMGAVYEVPDGTVNPASIYGQVSAELDTDINQCGPVACWTENIDNISSYVSFTLESPTFALCTSFLPPATCTSPQNPVLNIYVPSGINGEGLLVVAYQAVDYGGALQWTTNAPQEGINITPGNSTGLPQPATGVGIVTISQQSATTPAGNQAQIKFDTSPANAAEPGELTLLVNIVGTPAVTGISPASGPSVGGTQVTVQGSNFEGATEVDFGANAEFPCPVSGTPSGPCFTIVSSSTIDAVSPAGSAIVPGNAVNVVVKGPGGASLVNAPADQFTYFVKFVLPCPPYCIWPPPCLNCRRPSGF